MSVCLSGSRGIFVRDWSYLYKYSKSILLSLYPKHEWRNEIDGGVSHKTLRELVLPPSNRGRYYRGVLFFSVAYPTAN